MARGAQVVDVLPAEEYQDDHLSGAIHLPLRRIETEARGALDPAGPSSCTAGTRPETSAHEPRVGSRALGSPRSTTTWPGSWTGWPLALAAGPAAAASGSGAGVAARRFARRRPGRRRSQPGRPPAQQVDAAQATAPQGHHPVVETLSRATTAVAMASRSPATSASSAAQMARWQSYSTSASVAGSAGHLARATASWLS